MRATAARPEVSIARRASQVLGARGLRVDVALVAAVALLATAVRLPYLWLVPRFTDETLEVLHSLAIVRDGARPLTNYDSYYGALYNYLVALALAVSGESSLAPRVVVLAAGVLTVVATYGLGRSLGPRLLPGDACDARGAARLAGLLAAGLLATNGPHVVVNSHVAWSNCLTPLFTTLAFRALVVTRSSPISREAGEGGRGGGGLGVPAGLPLAGLLLGLALQTHPLVVALLPGVALGVLWRRWGLLKTPWPWIAVGCFLVGYANMLAFNVGNGFESIRGAQRISAEYAQDQQASPGYLPTLASMGLLLARILGGAVDQRGGWAEYLLDPEVLVIVGLVIGGLWWSARRGEALPLAATLGLLLILPTANAKFLTLITSRYLMPLVPLLFATGSVALVALVRALGERRPTMLAAGVVVGVLLVLAPLIPLDRYYDRALARSDTNERILRLTAEIQAARQPDEPVLIDDGIGSELPDTGVTELRGFEYLLTFARVPYRAIRPSPGRLQDELDRAPSVLAVLNARDAASAGGRLRVEPLDDRPPAESGRMSDFRLYRLTRARA
jgi:glycosyltransferase AglD